MSEITDKEMNIVSDMLRRILTEYKFEKSYINTEIIRFKKNILMINDEHFGANKFSMQDIMQVVNAQIVEVVKKRKEFPSHIVSTLKEQFKEELASYKELANREIPEVEKPVEDKPFEIAFDPNIVTDLAEDLEEFRSELEEFEQIKSTIKSFKTCPMNTFFLKEEKHEEESIFTMGPPSHQTQINSFAEPKPM